MSADPLLIRFLFAKLNVFLTFATKTAQQLCSFFAKLPIMLIVSTIKWACRSSCRRFDILLLLSKMDTGSYASSTSPFNLTGSSDDMMQDLQMLYWICEALTREYFYF